MEITKKAAKDLMEQLVAFPSITGQSDVEKCAEFISGWFQRNGVRSEIHPFSGVPDVVAAIGRKEGKRLLLDGHFDVIPAGDMAEWDTDPFRAVEKGGYLFGRGCADMKGGVAAAMLAMAALEEKEAELGGEIVFYGVGDEETGSVHGTMDLLSQYDRNFDGAIVPEPTDFCIERAQRGLRWIELHVKGKACHAGRPHVGRNAIEQACRLIIALKNIKYSRHDDLFEEGLQDPGLSVNLIRGGLRNNIIAEDCTFSIDRRMLPGETVEEVLRQIGESVEKNLEDGFSYDMHLVNNGWDPFVTDQQDPIVRMLTQAYRDVAGCDPVVRGKGGCTDASHISNAGIPVVILGPGSANESHTANEKIELDRIVMTAEIIQKAAAQYLS